MIRSRSNAAARPAEPADAVPSTVARIAPVEMRRVEQEAPQEAPAATEEQPADSTAKAQPEKDCVAGRARQPPSLLGAWYGDYYWTVGRFLVSTDDAYVGVHTATLAAKVPGYVAAVKADDNTKVTCRRRGRHH